MSSNGISNWKVTFRSDLSSPVVEKDYDPYHKATNGVAQKDTLPAYQAPKSKIETLGQIYRLMDFDKEEGQKAKYLYEQLKTRKDSPYYNQYSAYTNGAVDELNALGFDTSKLSLEWFNDQNNLDFMNTYLERSGTTNGAKAPTKKSSRENRIAYWLNQWNSSEAKTREAEKEYQDLMNEAAYMSGDKARNYSDNDIYDKLIGKDGENLKGKYSTLYDMFYNPDKTAKDYISIELNRGIGTPDDDIYGAMWAGRNPGQFDGDIEKAMAYNYLGKGNTWKDDPKIDAKLDPGSEEYQPFVFGTTMTDLAYKYNVREFAPDWCSKNVHLLNGSDQDIKEYKAIYNAEQDTLQGEQAREALYKWIDNYNGTDYEKAKKSLDRMLDKSGDVTVKAGNEKYTVRFNVLNAMDESMGKNGAEPNGNVVALTRSIDYKYADALNRLQQKCEQNANMESGTDYIEQNSESSEPKTSVPDMTIQAGSAVGTPAGASSGPVEIDAVSAAANSVKTPGSVTTDIEMQEPKAVNPAQSPVKPVKLPNQVNEIIKQKNQNVAEGIELAEPVLSDQEVSALKTYSADSNEVKEFMLTVPTSSLLNSNTAKTAVDFAGGMVNASVGYVTYGNAVAELPVVQQELEALSGSVSATQDQLDRLNTLRDVAKNPDAIVGLPWLLKVRDDYEKNTNNARVLGDLYSYVTGQDYDEQYDKNQIRDWADYIFNNDREMTEIAYEGDKASRMKDLQQREMVLEQTLSENKNAYAEYEQKNLWFDATIAAYEEQGLDTSELQIARAVSDYLTDMNTYQPTVWDTQSYYDGLAAEGKTQDEIGKIHEEQAVLLENARFVKEYVGQNGIAVPDQITNNLDRYIAALERDELDYQYYMKKYNADFSEKVEAGKELESKEKLAVNPNDRVIYDPGTKGTEIEVMAGLDKADYFPLMNEDEVNTYYYLYGTEGRSAAYAYYQHLSDDTYGVLNARQREKTEEAAANEVNANFWSGTWANIKAILSSAPEAILGLSYIIDRAITGQEYNPNASALTFGHYSAAVNETTMQSILDVCGDEEGNQTVWSKVVSGLYEIVYNRGRSAVNAAVFNFFGPNSAVPDIIKEFLGATPMAFGAASMSIADAKDKGASDGQAYTIGTVTMLAESLSEAITMSNIREAFSGGEVTADTFKKQLIKWLTQDGIEEMFGESVTDIVENLADELVMGDLSEHAERVKAWKEKDPRLTDEEAELLARQDEVASVLHTALISYLSPGLDLTSVAFRSVHSRLSYYRYETRRQQKAGNPTNLLKVRQQYNEAKKNGTLYKPDNSGKAPTIKVKTGTGVAPLGVNVNAVNAQQESESLSRDLSLIQSVLNADTPTKSDALSQVLGVANGTAEQTDEADAAATSVSRFFGGDMQKTADGIKTIVTGAYGAGISNEAVKTAVRTAALSESSQASAVMSSNEFQTATPEQKARMLADTVQTDILNRNVTSEISNSIYENRIANAESELIANGALDSLKPLQTTVDAATSAVAEAQNDLDAKNDALKVATDNLSTVNADYNQNTTEDNYKRLMDATTQVNNADESVHQYEQHLAKTQENLEQAEAKLNDARESAMTDVRQQAQEQIAQEDQQRQVEAEARAEQQRQQEEAARQAQAEEDERTGKAQEDRENTAIDEAVANENIEEEEKEQKAEELKDQRDKVKASLRDLNKPVSTTEGLLALRAFERKLGIKIDLVDLGKMEDGKPYIRGQYVTDKEGKNAVIRINSNSMTVGQALVEAALHEITHSMENTKLYKTYRSVVMGSMFGTENAGSAMDLYNEGNANYRSQIDTIIQERLNANDENFVGKSLTEQVEAAEREVVADFARLHLADRDVVQRFMDAGMGGRMRNTLHNINQALKNYLSGMNSAERRQAEYLRRAERAYQKAIDQVAKKSVHPESSQFSIMQIAQATKMTFDEETRKLYDKDGNEVDGVNIKITPDMINETPVGMLIDYGLSDVSPGVDENGNRIPSQRESAKEMMAGLMNMVARYKDSDLVWEIGATTLSSTFSALKSNSDPQYKTTVDFGTVCAKTQAIIDTLSQVMLDKVKNGEYGGLTRKDIMKVYDAVNKAGLSVPCPVCYVFSRWMGVPSLLGQMSRYQHDYVVTDKNGKIDRNATQEKVDAYIKNAEDKYGSAKAINNKKAQLTNKLTSLEEQQAELEKAVRAKGLTEEERSGIQKQIDDILDQMVDLDNQIGEVSAYNWITQALCKKDKSGKFVVDEKFKLTPDEILFDLNRTGEFAGYAKNWKYRNTRGAGMGKAIMPYSGETIGDILYGVKKGGRQSSIRNPWINNDPKAAARQLRDARTRAKKQNLVGGQRLQSTSDFRPEWGLDYIMSFLELQAAGSKVQMYTKVAEAVDFFASVGADVNLSIMGKGTGWREATAEEIAQMTPEQKEAATLNGKVYMLEFSDITGMKYDTAKNLKDTYDNVQMILVGMNDTHIRLAMKNSDIDFIIPWHSSGNSKEVLSGLISAVGEKLDSSVDYTTTQSDMVKGTVKKYTDENGNKVEYKAPGEQTADEKKLWDARIKLLTKGGKELTQEERNTLLSNPYTRDLYRRFTEKGVDNDCYGVKLSKEQASQIFPYEYWDTTSTKENADINGKRFVEYCEAMGIVPRFSQFKDDPGYWKLLIDRPMYNLDGSYHSQKVIDVTQARIGNLNEAGNLENSDLPTQAQAKYAPKDPRNPNYEKYTEAQKKAIEYAEAAINEKYDDGSTTQDSVYGTLTEADRQLMADAANDYADAVARGDMEAAQEDLDFAAEQNGYTVKAFHGTPEGGFTVFNTDKVENGRVYGNGIYFTSDESEADLYASKTGKNPQTYSAYLNLGDNPLIVDYDEIRNRVGDNKRYIAQEVRELYKAEYNDATAIVIQNRDKNNPEKTMYILKDSSQIKSADTVTYDDNGNVIPLDQRFSDSPDIRYSMEGERTAADRVLQNAQNQFDEEDWEIARQIARNNGWTDSELDENGDAWLRDQMLYGAMREDWLIAHGMQKEQKLNQELVKAGALTEEEAEAYNQKTAPRLQFEGLTDAENEILSAILQRGDRGNGERQWGRKGAQQSDELDNQVKEYLLKNNMYTKDTNAEQIDRALKWIRNNRSEGDPDGFYTSMQKVSSNRFNFNSPDGQAKMVAMMGMAVARGDLYAQIQLADAYNRQGTLAGQTLQARKIFKLMTPEGRIATLRKMLDDVKQEVSDRGGDGDKIKFSEWIYLAAAAADTEEDFAKVREAATVELGEQVPANWKDKIVGFRMLAMLGNPRTHVRNFGGNLLFMLPVGIKNKLGAVMEIMAGLDQGERTKTLGFANKESRQFAKDYSLKVEDVLRGEAKYNDKDKVRQNMKLWGTKDGIISKTIGKALQAYSDANGWALEKEDWVFLRRHFRNALAGYMTANKLTEADMTGETLEKATTYAINEAQKATYRDANSVATALGNIAKKGEGTKVERGAKAIQAVVNAVLPFKKTPANILRRGIEYSPIGLASTTADIKAMIDTVRYQNGKTSKEPKRIVTPAQFIDKISSGLTGSGIMALGFALARAGIARGGFDYDDPEDKIAQLRGEQEYGVNFGKLGNLVSKALGGVELFGEDVSRTMDWAAPPSMPFFVGVILNDIFGASTKGDDEKTIAQKFQGAVESLLSIAEPVFNLSVMDGVNRLFKIDTSNSKIPALDIALNIAMNYASSFVPTILGQAARTIDQTRRANYVESGAFLKQFWKIVEQVENKIPGVSEQNIPYMDAFGREQKNGSFFENFFAPWYKSDMKIDDAVINELSDVYNETKKSNFIPETAPKQFTIANKNYRLTDKEYEAFQKDQGEAWYDTINSLINNEQYQNADYATKAMMLQDARTYAMQSAKYHVDNNFKADKWVINALQNGNVAESIVENAKQANQKEFISDYSTELAKALKANDDETIDTLMEGLKQAGVEDHYDVARKSLTDYFKPLYQEAAKNDDEDTMDEIEEMLMDLDYGYRESDIHKWVNSKEVEEEEDEEIDDSRWLNKNT